MKKKSVLVLFLCLCLMASTASAVTVDGHVVVPSNQSFSVNGVLRECERYNIDGYNFFKLRDLAFLMNGTASQFEVGYDKPTNTVTVTSGKPYTDIKGTELVVEGDKSATSRPSIQSLIINGVRREDLTVWNIGGNNYFKLQELGEAVGFIVKYEKETRTAIANSTDYTPPLPTPVACERRSVSTSEGAVDAYVLTVAASDPRVTVHSALVDNRIGATASFDDIVAASGGAWAVVNGNFFSAYDAFKAPIGHVMVDGQFLYGSSGLVSLGVDVDGKLHMGPEPLFTRIRADDGKAWVAYEINTANGQAEGNSVLYTPAYGENLDLAVDTYLLTVRDGVITDYRWTEAGESVPIPADGYLLFLTKSYTEQPWISSPTLGSRVSPPESYLFNPTEDSFDLTGAVSILSGAPRLVHKGELCYETNSATNDASRFGPGVFAPRTAVGIDADGCLVIASTGSSTIQQMRELMLSLGCQEAVNLDGGASRALYCNGQYLARPGRQLTTTLQIFYTP